ncbi:hypothetical protein [Parvularcula sp. LCG005]|uniref:hypothetical protein n=1 Tax=Parvularcula sp. LCG005 TaxID=3078805 RepID=UPI0029435BE7|nr:hypothetical protein [Parvularcula sp. LCG005]WOI52971.1 hypothetical protein RUI03_12515 [Parvularcula sp. LCG005]
MEGAQVLARFDAVGRYEFELTVSDGFEADTIAPVSVDIDEYDVIPLAARPVDVDFSEESQALVTIDGKTLRRLMDGMNIETVTLSYTAAAVSQSPNGRRAAVAHDGHVSIVDLESMMVVAEYPIPADMKEVVFAEDDLAFLTDGNQSYALSVDNGAYETFSTSYSDYVVKRSVSGKIYGASRGSWSGDVQRFTLNGSGEYYAYDSLYHGDFDLGEDLYFSPGGGAILSPSGDVLRSAEWRQNDMKYAMSLSNTVNFLHADASFVGHQWYTIEDRTGATLLAADRGMIVNYDLETGDRLRTVDLPSVSATTAIQWNAQYVFAADSTPGLFVVGVDTSAPTAQYAILTQGRRLAAFENAAPKISTRRYYSSALGSSVVLDASASEDPENQSLTFDWSPIAVPSGAGTVSLQGARPSFVPTLAGTYQFEVRAYDGLRYSEPRRVEVTVMPRSNPVRVQRIEGDILDAEYSASQNVYIVLTGDRPVAKLFDAAGNLKEIELPAPGFAVGVSPDGRRAAISHNGGVTFIDVARSSVVTTVEIENTSTVDGDRVFGDIVIDHAGIAHVAPSADQWEEMISVNPASGAVTRSGSLYAGLRLAMHPQNNWIYGADTGLSPADDHKFDVSTGYAVNLGDSRYHGEYSLGTDLWLSQDGATLLNARGPVLRTTADASTDMTYIGKLQGSVVAFSAAHSRDLDRWAVMPGKEIYGNVGAYQTIESSIFLYSSSSLARTGTIALSTVPTSAGALNARGRYVAFTENGRSLNAIVAVDGRIDGYALQFGIAAD